MSVVGARMYTGAVQRRATGISRLICFTDGGGGGGEHRLVPPIVKRVRGAIDSYCERTAVRVFRRRRRFQSQPPPALHYDAAHAVHVVRYGSREPTGWGKSAEM